MVHCYRLYLHPNGTYYHRVKVPADIRALYGKEIEQQSLRTRDIRDAVRLLPAVIVSIDKAFDQCRLECAGEGPSSHVGTKRSILKPRRPAVALQEAPDHGCSRFPKISVLGAECFESVGRTKAWSAKTAASRTNQLKQFIDICGDKPLDHYTQEDIRHLKATLFALPPQSRGKATLKALSKPEIVAVARTQGLRGLSVESVRQVMTAANIVFGWARAEYDLNLRNIVQPMIPKPSSGGDKRDKRDGFTINELKTLFSSPVFYGVKSRERWFETGPVTMNTTGRFWVPLLCLYSGLRLMEAVQLSRGDVRVQGGIWFIDVNDEMESGNSKTIKTMYSSRRVPIHPTLLEFGFLNLVKTISAQARLFPDISIGPAEQRHRHASKMFNKLLAKAGIKGPRKVWHSLRHTFEQACRDSRVDSAIMDQLQGHVQMGMRGVYGGNYGLEALNEGICSIEYRGLDLSHITRLLA
jgi:integrase